jgi:MFS family permease
MGHDTSDSTAWPPPRTAWYAVLVLFFAYLLSYVDRQILSMLVGPIKADLGLNDTQISLLHGLAFAVCFTLLGVWPVGRWADTGNRRNVIAGGIALWSLMTALCGRASSFPGLFLARVGVGVGEAALAPSAYSMLADYFPPHKRGRALGLFTMGVYFGIGAAIMITGALLQSIAAAPSIELPLLGTVRTWQAAFLIVGPPGLLVALWMLTVSEPQRRGPSAANARFADVCRFVFDRAHARFYVGITIGVSLLTMLFNAAAFWIPAHLMRVHGYSPAQVATTYGPLMLIFGAAGVLAGGALADYWRRLGRYDAELRVAMLSALTLWPIAVVTFRTASADTMVWLLGPMLFLSSMPFAATSAAIQLATPNEFRARTSAMYLLVLNLTGIGFGSTAAALVSDYVLQDDKRIGEGVALVAAVAAPLAVLSFWLARAAYGRLQDRPQPGRTGTKN